MIDLRTSAEPAVSVLIRSLGNVEALADCLESIARTASEEAPYETLVLFQQTSAEAAGAFAAGVRGLRVLRTGGDLGFTAGSNYAARHAAAPRLVFLKETSAPQPGWLQALLGAANAGARPGAVASRLEAPDGTLVEAGCVLWNDGSYQPVGRGGPPGSLAYTYVRPVDCASPDGLLVDRETFERAGGFDERYFGEPFATADLCLRIRYALGRTILYEPRSIVVERDADVADQDAHFEWFLARRNRALFAAAWAPRLQEYGAPEPASDAAVERAILRRSGDPRRVLLVDDRVPRAAIGSGFGRSADLLADLHAAGYAVAMAPTARRRLPARNDVGSLGADLVLEPLEEHLARPEKRYDAIVVSRPHNFRNCYETIRRLSPHSAVIYDVEALYHRRIRLEAALERDPSKRERLETEAASVEALERHIAQTADRLVAISESELAWLEALDGHAPVEFMRPLAHVDPEDGPRLESRAGAVFAAGWLAGSRSPNVDALRWYARDVVPHVRRALPGFTTYVTGGNPPLEAREAATGGICLLGHVDSMDRVYAAARVAISPMLAGAGVKIKTIEALQHGVPVVATTVGAEGLGLVDGVEIDVADDPREYADRVIRLAADDAVWLARRDAFERRIETWRRERTRWSDVVARALA